MPRKRNKRKEIQAARRLNEPKPKRVVMIDPVHAIGRKAKLSLAMAAVLSNMRKE